jgi:hypothetical protein
MKNEEHHIQVGIVNYLRMNNVVVFAVPNGGQRAITTARMLKAEGCQAGVSDLIILENGTCRFIEVKTAKGRQQESQKEFEAIVNAHNMKYEVWRDIDDAVEYVKNLRERVIDEV